MTEQCSGRVGNLSQIDWFVVPGVSSFSTATLKDVSGVATRNRIILAGNVVQAGPVVRHEMLHVLLDRGGHPREDFIGRCGLLVSCSDDCIAESQAPPALSDAVSVPDTVLEVSASVWPEVPSTTVLGGYLRLTVSARNPLDKPVVVPIPVVTGTNPHPGFRYRMSQGSVMLNSIARPVRWPEVTRFNAGERKDMVFDLWVRNEFTNLRGTYQFLGGYGEKWGAPISVTITQQ